MARPHLDEIKVNSAKMMVEIEAIKSGCQGLHREVVDKHAQGALRRKIVHDQLDRVLVKHIFGFRFLYRYSSPHNSLFSA